MGRFVLNKPPAASGGAILSSAVYDAGFSAWKGSTTGSWQFCFNTEELCKLKVVKANPLFDIEFNIQTDHVTTWDSQAYRLVARYGGDSNANSSAWKGPNIMTQHGTWTDNANVCGRSTGVQNLWRPTGYGLQPGNYIKFAIQRWGDPGGSNNCYLNQASENGNGTNDQGNDWQGGGFFIRVRELDPAFVTCRGNQINTSTGNA